ncbi:MAG: hypothetical protein KBB16_00195 [Candidatus Pacebacteria bacterium]|nr:hypothetical protein [Candidatus Paceibacterota bacterium]
MENPEFNKRIWEKPVDVTDLKSKSINTENININPINRNQAELTEEIRNDMNSIEDKKDKIKLPMKVLDMLLEKENLENHIKTKKKEIEDLDRQGNMQELYVARQEYSILNEQYKKINERFSELLLSNESYMKAYKEYGKNKVERDIISNPINPRWN